MIPFRHWLAFVLLAALAPLQARETPVDAAVAPRQAAIATANAYATDAGLEVLAKGGNAFDAAVAVSATLGLVEPESSVEYIPAPMTVARMVSTGSRIRSLNGAKTSLIAFASIFRYR